MVREWLLKYSGFSVGIRDCLNTDKKDEETEKEINKYIDKALQLTNQAHQGIMLLKHRASSCRRF